MSVISLPLCDPKAPNFQILENKCTLKTSALEFN